jgi:hypothetical protein
MSKPYRCLKLVFLTFCLVSFGPAAAVLLPAAESSLTARQEGKARAAHLCAQQPSENFSWPGVLWVKSRAGQLSEIPVTLQVRLEARGWRDVYEASITNGGFHEQLVIIHEDPQTIRYLRARAKIGEPFGELATVPADQLYQSFAQTDFSLLDLGLDFFHWPEQSLVRTNEIRRTRSCYVLDSIPPTIAPGGYGRVRSWVDSVAGGVVVAEAYDYQQKLLKKFSINRIERVNGQYRLKEMEIRNLLTGSRTQLKLDLTISLVPPN